MTAAPHYTLPDPPTVAVQGLQRALMALGHGIMHTLQLHVVPHLGALVARRDVLRARADGGELRPRIAIVGGPRTGKTTAGLALADIHGLPIVHSDDLKHLGWSEASDALAQIIASSRSGVFEGVAVARALRKLLNRYADKPVDTLVRLRTPRVALTQGQAALTAGHDRVLDEIMPELERRGVRVLELSDVVLAPRPVALRASMAGIAPRMDARDPLLSDLFALARDQLHFNPRPPLLAAGRLVDELTAVTLERQVAQALGLAGRYELRQLRAAATRTDAKKKPKQPQVASIDPFATPIGPQLEAFVNRGTLRVGKMTDAMYAEAQKIVREHLERGERQEGIAAALARRVTGLTEQQATIIANDAVAQFHAAQTELRQTGLGITHYTWRATHDPLTRPAHLALDGTNQAWDAPPVTNPKTGKRAHPGQDTHYYACRCSAIPIIDAAVVRPPAGSPYSAPPRLPTAPVQLPLPGQPPPPFNGPLPVVATPPKPIRSKPAKAKPTAPKPTPPQGPSVTLQPPLAPPPIFAPPPPAPPPAPIARPPIITPPPAPAPAPTIAKLPSIPNAKQHLGDIADGALQIPTLRDGDIIDAAQMRLPLRRMLEDFGLTRARDGAVGSADTVPTIVEASSNYARGDAATSPMTGRQWLPPETVNSVADTFDRIDRRDYAAITREDFNDAITLTHEEIHLYGPTDTRAGLDPSNWELHVEEVSTELLARHIMTELAITPKAPAEFEALVRMPQRIGNTRIYEAAPRIPYDDFIAATMTSIAEVTGWDHDTVVDAIRRAALSFKQHHTTIETIDAMDTWLAGVPGLSATERTALRDSFTTVNTAGVPDRRQDDYLLEWERKVTAAQTQGNP